MAIAASATGPRGNLGDRRVQLIGDIARFEHDTLAFGNWARGPHEQSVAIDDLLVPEYSVVIRSRW